MTRIAAELFLEAREMSAERRAGYLDGACGQDAALRAEVEALLRAEERAGGFMASPTGDVPAASPAPAAAAIAATPREEAGALIGRYKLLEQIGEGGMGTIWMAEQREPVKRRVALKIIKLGMDTKQVIVRFEAERQALAMMDHPHIAKVLDAGATETGRPYFVMEYIKGIPILEYCDKERLDTKARLELLKSVCHAIQHAHQKGIIHRDIKPSNVLVTLHDGIPIPKVIDFGIAKATNSELTAKTLFTEHRQMVGTPAYMSPEQAEMSGLDIDTRSDIYSLGVLLYELLTGTTPFRKDILVVGFEEMLRVIREVEPQKPSTRISTLGDTGTRTAQQRRVDVKRLGSILRGDLDWIVMRCLEKDRTRRYDTANGLAADIQRHLAHEPVTAGPPSTWYKLRKFVQRNRGTVVAGGIVAVALVLGVVGTTTGMLRALDEKERADKEATKATLAALSEAKARVSAQENEQKAIAEARRAEAAKEEEAKARARAETISEFVTTALRSGDAENQGGGQDMTILAAMDSAIADIDSGRFKDDPETEAGLKSTIGTILQNNGRLQQAESLLAQALEARKRLHPGDHPDVARDLSSLAIVREILGRPDEAETLGLQALEMSQRLYAGDHPDAVAALNVLAGVRRSQGRLPEADTLLVQALEISQRLYRDDGPGVALALNNVAVVRQAMGRNLEAELYFAQALEIWQRVYTVDHPKVALGLHNLAFVRVALGRHAEAEPLLVQALEMNQRLYKDGHPTTANFLATLAGVRQALGRPEEAEPLYAQALEMCQRLYKGDHPSVARGLNSLARVRMELGRYAEADALLVQARELSQRLHKGDHPDLASTLNSLASVRQALGRHSEAETLFEQSLQMYQRLHGENHPNVLMAKRNLGVQYWKQGKLGQSIPLFEQVLKAREATLGREHPDTLSTIADLGVNYNDAGRLAEAVPLLEEAYQASRKFPFLAYAGQKLAKLYWSQGNLAKSVPLFEEILEARAATLGRQHPDTLMAVADLGVNYRDAGRLAEAIPLLEEAYRASKKEPKLAWVGPELFDAYDRAARAKKPVDTARVVGLMQELLATERAEVPKDSPELADKLAEFGLALLGLKAWEEAEPLIRECLAIREQAQPDAWRTFNSKSQLGEALLGQKKLAEAEPLLLDGYRGMKEREATIEPGGRTRIPEALERLVQLYEAAGNATEAAAWRSQLEAARAEQGKAAARGDKR